MSSNSDEDLYIRKNIIAYQVKVGCNGYIINVYHLYYWFEGVLKNKLH